jgi:pyruvate/2-oxoacid:ferredoxin oxidoreductase beta subunit
MLEYHPVPSTYLSPLERPRCPACARCYFAKLRRALAGSTTEHSNAENAVAFTRSSYPAIPWDPIHAAGFPAN